MNFFQKLFGCKSKQSVEDDKRQEASVAQKAREERKEFSDANYSIGQELLNNKQYEAAFRTFKLIAENDDHMDAQFNLAVMYHRGLGTEKNIHEAIRWYEETAKHNDNQAMYNLGLIYHQGDDGIPQDNEKTFHWMRESYINGNDKARAFLLETAVSAFEYIANDLKLAPTRIEGQPMYAILIPTSEDITKDNLPAIMRIEGKAEFICNMPFRFTEEMKKEFELMLQLLNENTHVAKLRFNDENQLQSKAVIKMDQLIKEADDMHDFYDLLFNITDIAAGETRRFYDTLNEWHDDEDE